MKNFLFFPMEDITVPQCCIKDCDYLLPVLVRVKYKKWKELNSLSEADKKRVEAGKYRKRTKYEVLLWRKKWVCLNHIRCYADAQRVYVIDVFGNTGIKNWTKHYHFFLFTVH